MSIKGIYLDYSGVISIPRVGHPHDVYAQQLGITSQALKEFFEGDLNRQVDLGEITQVQFFDRMIQELGLTPESIEIFQEAFREGFELNQALLDFVQTFSPNIKIGLLSNYSDRLRRVIEEELNIVHIFDVTIISCEVKLLKPDKAIYQLALERMGIQPNEMVFVDDRIENIESAAEMGIHAIQFKETEQVIAEIKQLMRE